MTVDPISVVSPISIPLSGEWSFAVDKDNSGEGQGWTNADFEVSSWTTVQVPHTWNVMPEYSEYEGFAWYRRTFIVPDTGGNAHVRLKFDAVFYLARVFGGAWWEFETRIGGNVLVEVWDLAGNAARQEA